MKRLVLVGPGNAHLLVLAGLAQRPLPGVEVHLVALGPRQPYSAMLSGLLAGEYTESEVHIDLVRLCERAGAVLHGQGASGVDLAARRVELRDGTALAFDIAALNVGAVAPPLPGREQALGLKPLVEAPAALAALRRAQRVVVMGGGAAGVELALCLSTQGTAEITLVARSTRLPHDASGAMDRAAQRLLAARGVRRVEGRVVAVERAGVRLASGALLPCDAALDARGAAPVPWLRATGLQFGGRGFVQVDDALRSTSHPFVFGAGDTIDFASGQRVPRAGVFAVRQAKTLAHNLRAALADRGALVTYRAQRRHLAILDAGDGTALLGFGAQAVHSRWALSLKRAIDARFMRRF